MRKQKKEDQENRNIHYGFNTRGYSFQKIMEKISSADIYYRRLFLKGKKNQAFTFLLVLEFKQKIQAKITYRKSTVEA